MFNLLPQYSRSAGATLRQRVTLTLCLLLLPANAGWAKEVPVTGILLYGSKDSMAYVQVSGFLINGKTELRACSGSGPIEKNTYKNLPKISLSSVKSLERLPDGSMVAEVGEAAPSCVVPSNYKFEKENSLTQEQLADKSTFTGGVVGSSAAGQTALPPFAAGSKIVFGSPSDKELADYLLADRVQTIASLQAYLSSNGVGAHAGQARTTLTGLLIKDGAARLALFKSSRATPAPDYASLKQAHDRADQALVVVPTDAAAIALRDSVRAELKQLTDTGTAKLQAFQEATKARQPGYPLLVTAKDLSGRVTTVDPKYAPGITLAAAVATETRSLDSLVATADKQIAASQYDDAYSTIGKYRSFADEEPRLKTVVDAVYKYHMEKGNTEVGAASWKEAVADLKAAVDVNATVESKDALAKAEAGLVAAENRAAADKALAISKSRMDDNDAIGAYEILADLPPDQKILVNDQLTALQDGYVAAATKKGIELQSAHTPIRGREDENAVRQAYAYFERAGKLSDNPEIGLKLEVMADTISKYYVDVASRYLSKPLSSGVGLGFAYLNEATVYRPNLDVVRDAMTTNNAAYQMRARLSVGVVFRDQTSHRDFADFADQLQQAFATGLESSGLPVRVILPGASGTLEPNFRFVGEILQHRIIRDAKKETLQSQYRSGVRDLPNEAWNKADQEFESASIELQKIQSALAAAQAKNNKKMIDQSTKELSAQQEIVQQARGKMNSIPRNVGTDVISPYNYTRTTINLTNIVELSFRTIDASGATVGDPIKVIKGEKPRKFVILDNIKPDDTQGLKEIDTQPDEQQLMTDVEIEARDAIVAAARERVLELPKRIIAQARSKVASNDLEGAAESYVLYLNCTPAEPTPERTEAVFFLNKNFNIRNTLNLRASAQ
jgi:hypothetical protein